MSTAVKITRQGIEVNEVPSDLSDLKANVAALQALSHPEIQLTTMNNEIAVLQQENDTQDATITTLATQSGVDASLALKADKSSVETLESALVITGDDVAVQGKLSAEYDIDVNDIALAAAKKQVALEQSEMFNLIPRPAEISSAIVQYPAGTNFSFSSSDFDSANLTMIYEESSNLAFVAAGPGVIPVSAELSESLSGEDYDITATAAGVKIAASTFTGAMYGLITFGQMMNSPNRDDCLPRFIKDRTPADKLRKLHIDVSRHFRTVDELKKVARVMTMYKLNAFHLHLCDDQGWRFEVPGYPNLVTIGSVGNYSQGPASGVQQYYTAADMKDVVAYCDLRGIQVIPEFDLPGHTTALLASYPEFGTGAYITVLNEDQVPGRTYKPHRIGFAAEGLNLGD